MTLLLLWGCQTDPQSLPPRDTSVDPTTTAVTSTQEVVLLTLNLHCFKVEGTSYPDNDARFAGIATTVAAEGVDAIAVQEACENTGEGVAMSRLALALQEATGDTWKSVWTPTHMAWTGTHDEAQEGVGLLRRGGPPTEVAPFRYTVQGSQERWLLAGNFDGFRLMTVHLEHDSDAARLGQARQTALFGLLGAERNVLIAGDFNARAEEAPLLDLEAAGYLRLTAAADTSGEIDHIFAPISAGMEVLDTRMAFTGETEPPVSDHPGVLLHLRIGAPSEAPLTHFVAHSSASNLFLRGDTAPLSWEQGWPAVESQPDTWEAAFLSWPSGNLQYKWLTEDQSWETGDNHTLPAGRI